MAFRFIDSLALNLPNKVIYTPIIQAANLIRTHQSPWARKASYLAIGVMSEGCSDFLKQDLEVVLNTLIQGFQDSHQSVREAVGLSLGYCSEHLKPEIMDYH
mmetsp:Transcript_25841/g.4362  ORF Transcript_25841/g.4362 Transcript_25841/m.4362 type:complete len:102 (-) Transcript_25841:987-1292(-)